MGKTYTNEITEHEVSLAIEHILVAAVGTAVTTPGGRIDIEAPPSGFTHLGCVVEDSPTLTVGRSKYQLQTGIPSVLQYDAVTGLTGQFSASLYGHSNQKVKYALGAVNPIYTFGASTTFTAGTYASVTGYISFAASTTSLTVGDIIAISEAGTVGSLANTLSTLYEAEIITLAAGTVTAKGLRRTITATGAFGKVTNSRICYGTTQITKYYLIGVADFLDGFQLQHHFYKVSPGGDFTENIQPGQAPTLNTAWDMYGTKTTTYGGSELILGERFWVAKNS